MRFQRNPAAAKEAMEAARSAGTGGTGALLSDGTGVWWAAAQLEKKKEAAAAAEGGGIDALLAGLQAMPPSNIADEALNEWLKFFAGHSGGAGDS